jgi:serine/threonine protein kinase
MIPKKRGKRWLITLACLVFLACWMGHVLQYSLIITRDGNSILSPEVWKVKSAVFYTDGSTLKALPANDVSRIVMGSLTDPSCYYPLLSQHLLMSLGKVSDRIPLNSLAKIVNHPFVDSVKPHLALIVYTYLALFLFIMGFRGLRKGRRKKGHFRRTPDDEGLVRLANFSDVESLFLSLFKKKLGAPESAPSKINKVVRSGKSKEQLVDLKVFHENKWHKRRMTLAPIGDDTGSKSQCFYVIFDTHMVIKIPTTPITDFDDYIARVQAETKIMQRLAPRICVIPNLAVILGRIHPYSDADTISPAFIENRYIRWLRSAPENQRFLTIGGSFVFFMDLARYYFLGHVTAGFHSMDAGLTEEIRADIDNLTDMSAFEGKYDRQGGELWPALYKAYGSYRKELHGIFTRTDTPASLSDRKIKKLFLSSMAGQDPGLADLKVPADLKALLEKLLARTVRSGETLKQRYRELLTQYAEQRLFTRSRPLMDVMVTNLLELLAWAGEKKISFRDLKPDNLLVAGDPDNYPHFLTSLREYTIGLIDLETAVDFGDSSPTRIPQPQLGGTPLYCTPSHFFPNTILEEVYGDLPLVLHLQDWYAMTAIIFEVVTGEKLFKDTGYQVPLMMKSVLQAAARNEDLKTKFLHFTRQFHNNARREIRAKIKRHESRLQAVSARIAETIQQQLLEDQQAALSAQREELNRILDSHPAFNEGSNRQWLEKSSVAELGKLQTKYKNRKDGAGLTESIRQMIRIRKENDTLTTRIEKLTGQAPQVSTDTLLEMMFALVEKKLLTNFTLPAPDPALEIPTAEETGEEELAKTAALLEYSATIQV